MSRGVALDTAGTVPPVSPEKSGRGAERRDLGRSDVRSLRESLPTGSVSQGNGEQGYQLRVGLKGQELERGKGDPSSGNEGRMGPCSWM